MDVSTRRRQVRESGQLLSPRGTPKWPGHASKAHSGGLPCEAYEQPQAASRYLAVLRIIALF